MTSVLTFVNCQNIRCADAFENACESGLSGPVSIPVKHVLHIEARIRILLDEFLVPLQVFHPFMSDLASQLDTYTKVRSRQTHAEPADQTQIHPVIERVAAIKHDHGSPARAKHAVNLPDGPRRIRCVVKYSVGIHEVERTGGERQVLSVTLDETSS
ncbi:MAG: hypothetical protein WA603_00865 [Candidatus Acidiferrales bacterium]